jgi:hypothetical protein
MRAVDILRTAMTDPVHPEPEPAPIQPAPVAPEPAATDPGPQDPFADMTPYPSEILTKEAHPSGEDRVILGEKD